MNPKCSNHRFDRFPTPTLFNQMSQRPFKGREHTLVFELSEGGTLQALVLPVSYSNVLVTSVRGDGYQMLMHPTPAVFFMSDEANAFGVNVKKVAITLRRIPYKPRRMCLVISRRRGRRRCKIQSRPRPHGVSRKERPQAALYAVSWVRS